MLVPQPGNAIPIVRGTGEVGESNARYLARRRAWCDARPVQLSALVERVLPLAILALAAIGAPVMILSPEGLPRLEGLEHELTEVEAENARVRREIEELRGRVTRLRDDPAAVERIARDHLGLVRQTEVVFQFPAR